MYKNLHIFGQTNGETDGTPPAGDIEPGRRGVVSAATAEKLEKEKKISKNTQKGVDIFLCMCYNEVTKTTEVLK